MPTLKFTDLLAAYEFASAGAAGENSAYVNVDTGAIHFVSEMIDLDEEVPDDLETSDRYLAVPDKYDLDLGRELALSFVDQEIPDDYAAVADFFRHKGAYGRFKNRLESRGLLEKWYAFEADSKESALREWCQANNIELSPALPGGGLSVARGIVRLPTEICLVRDWQLDDKAALVSLANNRKVWRNLTHLFPHPYTEADADEWFLRLAETFPMTHWAIESDGELVGGIGLFLGEGVHSKSARLGYWIGEPFWGRGIATSAVQAVTRHAVPAYSLCRIEAAVFSWNLASARVLEKAGYTKESVLRRSIFKDGEVIDSIMYAFTVGNERSGQP